jgi:Peptidase family S41
MRRFAGLAFLLLLVSPLFAAKPTYLEDFEFIRKTVASEYAALQTKKIDWARVCADQKPSFEACENDVDHVKNVMRLLAALRDSHTGVTRTSVPSKKLPSKWDGLYGGGLWIGWDNGRLVLIGLMDGHSLTGTIPLGSTIVSIEGEPAWLAMERERRRITTFEGTSSSHSLFSAMDNRLLPFGEKQAIEVLFLTPEGKTKKASVRRWGPGGKSFYPSSATLPPGVTWQAGAVEAILELPWSSKVGYLRITGSMDRETVTAVHAALDRLKGIQALLLDCRGMGGGGDGSAWEIAGRFFPEGVDNGLHGRIEASGSWQFGGPVVMLQDEKEVSSAETFTWAMSETRRVISVGRPTGGWGIIPRGYKCPSGLVSFRLGVNARPTPIGRVQTEGIGWPPDVEIPYGPAVRGMKDPVFDVGLQVLRVLAAGAPVAKTRALFAGLFQGQSDEFAKSAAKLAEVPGWDPRPLARLAEQDLLGRLELECALLTLTDAGPPDARGAARRLMDLTGPARAAGRKSQLARLEKVVKRSKTEANAIEEFLEITDAKFGAPQAEQKSYLKKHRKTAFARYVKERLWSE